MLKSTYVQQCAHNLSERRRTEVELNTGKISLQRRKFLRNSLNRLNKEKAFFLSIKNEFILSPKDCWKL